MFGKLCPPEADPPLAEVMKLGSDDRATLTSHKYAHQNEYLHKIEA